MYTVDIHRCTNLNHDLNTRTCNMHNSSCVYVYILYMYIVHIMTMHRCMKSYVQVHNIESGDRVMQHLHTLRAHLHGTGSLVN